MVVLTVAVATQVDLAFFNEMYPYQNRNERPTLHVSLPAAGKSGDVRAKWQPAAPARGQVAAKPAPGGGPPEDSADWSLLQMVMEVSKLVALPAVEFVAHTDRLPKVRTRALSSP